MSEIPPEPSNETQPLGDASINNENSTTTGETKSPIEEAIEAFILSIEGVRETAPFMETVVFAMLHKHKTEFEKERDNYGTILDENDGKQNLSFPLERASRARELLDRLAKTRAAHKTLPNMLLLALISLYDAYLYNLLKALFQAKPELVFTSDKEIRFSEIVKFDSLDDVKQGIVEKEIEGILRKSHAKQFDTLERIFNVQLRSDLDVWPDFIEITERRNLLAHANGVVSRHYIEVCRSSGVTEDRIPNIGEVISFTPDDLETTYEVLFEICLKLGHVLWRKTLPGQLHLSDAHYNAKCFDLIKAGQYQMAIKMLDFICDVVKAHSGQELLLYMKINRCNAYRLGGEQTKCLEFLDKIDTSALGLEFRLAEAILRIDYQRAAAIMRQLGDDHETITRFAYSDWPIFEQFRDSEDFLEAYEEIFGETFTVTTDIEDNEDTTDND